MNNTETNNSLQNSHIKKVIDKVIIILGETRNNVDSADEFETAFNLLTAKAQLSKLLNSITDLSE